MAFGVACHAKNLTYIALFRWISFMMGHLKNDYINVWNEADVVNLHRTKLGLILHNFNGFLE